MSAWRRLRHVEGLLGELERLDRDRGATPAELRQAIRRVKGPLADYGRLLGGVMLWQKGKRR